MSVSIAMSATAVNHETNEAIPFTQYNRRAVPIQSRLSLACCISRSLSPLNKDESDSDVSDEYDEEIMRDLVTAVLDLNVDEVKTLLERDPSHAYHYSNERTLLKICSDVDCSNDFQLESKVNISMEIVKILVGSNKKLHYVEIVCIFKLALDVIETFMKKNESADSINNHVHPWLKDFTTTLHVTTQRSNTLKFFLENLNRQDVKEFSEKKDVFGYAPIHTAALLNELESMKLLLKTFGDSQVTLRSNNNKTVLQVAARHGSYETAEYLLHWHKSQLLVKNNRSTPLILSIQHRHEKILVLLLKNGAVLSEKDNEGITALELILKTFDNAAEIITARFDDCIKQVKEIQGKKIKVDYSILTSNIHDNSCSQIDLCEKLVRSDSGKLLKHPLLMSLIFLKWKHLLPVLYCLAGIYAIFLTTFTVFVYTRYVWHLNPSRNWSWILYLSAVLLLLEECYYMYWRRLSYIYHLDSWVKLVMLLLVLVTLVAAVFSSEDMLWDQEESWEQHVAGGALLFSWLYTMFLVARFINWGDYVLMFEIVVFNMFKILMLSMFIIIGFALCYLIEYQSESPFDGTIAAFIKTFVLMTAGFDDSYLLAPNKENGTKSDQETFENYGNMVHVILMILFIFITILLANFMTGVAVGDTCDLSHKSEIKRLEKQVEILNTFTSSHSAFLKSIPLFNRCHRLHHWKLYRNPSNKSWCAVTLKYTQAAQKQLRKTKEHADKARVDLNEKLEEAIILTATR